jgi:uncharacterized LabA/DUF88 family protein
MASTLQSYRRVCVYIDGFNLYYRSLKNAQYPAKWLNPKQFIINIFPHLSLEIKKIKYFTADVSGRDGSSAPKDQATYIKALHTLDEIEVIKGRFSVHEKYARLSQPIEFYPDHFEAICTKHKGCDETPMSAKIIKYEEKGSDVNLASHLLRDAFTDEFDLAIVVTADTDLLEPIRMVMELGKNIKLVSPREPHSKSNRALKQVHTSFVSLLGHQNIVENNQRIIETSQFARTLTSRDGAPIEKPLDW